MNDIEKYPWIGIIGGTAWPSTTYYLDQIHRGVQDKLGGLSSPNLSIKSVNFAQIDAWIHAQKWDEIRTCFTDLVMRMRESDQIAAFAILSNTLHRVAEGVSRATGVPVIHIGDCTAKCVWEEDLDRVGFIGTKTTMTEDFILKYYTRQGITVFTPPEDVMDGIDDIIFGELCRNEFDDVSREFLFRQVAELIANHSIEGVILGCTELGLTMTREYWSDFCQRNQRELTTTCQRSIEELVNFSFIDATECHIDMITEFCCHAI